MSYFRKQCHSNSDDLTIQPHGNNTIIFTNFLNVSICMYFLIIIMKIMILLR